MTANTIATIWCDESPTSARMNCGEFIQGNSAKEARAEAKYWGWTVNVEDPDTRVRRDYCRAHNPNSIQNGADT